MKHLKFKVSNIMDHLMAIGRIEDESRIALVPELWPPLVFQSIIMESAIEKPHFAL